MRQVYQAGSVIDAQLVCDLLKDAGFDAVVHGGYLSGAIGELPPDTLVSVYLLSAAAAPLPLGWTHRPVGSTGDGGSIDSHDGAADAVSDTEFERARALIAEYEASARQRRADSKPRRCGACGEESEAAFGLCWNCQASLEDAP